MAKYSEQERELAYKIYVTDSLMYAPQMMHKVDRYCDLIMPKKIDTRSAEEIIDDIIAKGGLKKK